MEKKQKYRKIIAIITLALSAVTVIAFVMIWMPNAIADNINKKNSIKEGVCIWVKVEK